MADLSKVKIGESTYNLKDTQARADVATAQGAITAEVTRATGAESSLDTRITALESKGRYLSTWDATTGLPETYPEDSQFVEGKYNYRAGDYYIVNKVGASNKMPDGAYITKDGSTYTVPSKSYTGTLNLGDQFQYDGTTWTHIASATTVAFANIQGDAMENTNLAGKLNAKANVADLGDLASKDSASGTVSGQTISGVKATGTLSAALTGSLGESDASATITTKAAFTPQGNITGSAISGGSINVTVKDAATATAVTDLEYENFTPEGTISPKATGGTSAVLASATFEADANGTAVSGTVSKPNVTITAGTEKTFATGLTGGKVASIDTTKFSGGSFTGASAASFTQGAKASFTQGAKAALTTSNISYVEEGVKVAVDEDDEEMLVFSTVSAKSAKAVDTWTANGDDSFTANGDDSFTANNVGTFTAAAISEGFFSANELQSVSTGTVHDTPTAALAEAPTFTGDKFRVATTTDTVLKDVEFSGTAAAVKLTGAKYLKQEIDDAEFSGTAATLGFAGTEVANLIPTAIGYKKTTIGSLAATAALPEGGLTVGDIVVSDKTVTVE